MLQILAWWSTVYRERQVSIFFFSCSNPCSRGIQEVPRYLPELHVVTEVYSALLTHLYHLAFIYAVYTSKVKWVNCDVTSSHFWMDLHIALKDSENQDVSDSNVYNGNNILCDVFLFVMFSEPRIIYHMWHPSTLE